MSRAGWNSLRHYRSALLSLNRTRSNRIIANQNCPSTAVMSRMLWSSRLANPRFKVHSPDDASVLISYGCIVVCAALDFDFSELQTLESVGSVPLAEGSVGRDSCTPPPPIWAKVGNFKI